MYNIFMKILKKIIPRKLINVYHLIEAIIAVILFGYPARKLVVIGVTGTDGKTTTSNFIYQILLQNKYKVGLISTVGAYLGETRIDLGAHVTTPSRFVLQRLMRQMVHQGYTHVILEVTSHGLDQYRTLGSNITYSLITNISPEHLDYHKTFENYIRAKAKIFSGCKVALVNQKDQQVIHTLKPYLITVPQVILYSHSTPSHYHQAIKKHFQESHNQENLLGASLMCENLGVSSESIKKTYTQLSLPEGRLEPINNNAKLHIYIDFAHTPQAIRAVLQSIKPKVKGKLFAVYGSAGLRDHLKRPDMGLAGAEHADYVVFTSEDPRSENPLTIINQMKSKLSKYHGKVVSIADRSKAITYTINNLAKSGDTVMILGKGHESSMNLDGKGEIPWSDKNIVLSALKERK